MLEINNLIETRLFEEIWCDTGCSVCLSGSGLNKNCNNIFMQAVRYSLSGNDYRLRSILMLSLGRAHKKEELSLPIALAFECIHNSAIILDDIFDNGKYRNGRKCTYIVFSKPTAVLVSVYLTYKGFQFLKELKDHVNYEQFIKIHQIFATYPQNLINGEYKKNNLRIKKHTKQNYFDVLHWVSSCLTSFGFEATAAAIENEQYFITNAKKFGSNLGCLLQIENDLLDICGYENPFYELHDYNLLDVKNNDPNLLTTLIREHTNENISCENIHGLIDDNIKDAALNIAESYHKNCINCVSDLVSYRHQNQIKYIINGILDDIKKILYK